REVGRIPGRLAFAFLLHLVGMEVVAIVHLIVAQIEDVAMAALGLVVVVAVLEVLGLEGLLAEVRHIAVGVGAFEEAVGTGAVERVIFGDVPGHLFAAGFGTGHGLTDVLDAGDRFAVGERVDAREAVVVEVIAPVVEDFRHGVDGNVVIFRLVAH